MNMSPEPQQQIDNTELQILCARLEVMAWDHGYILHFSIKKAYAAYGSADNCFIKTSVEKKNTTQQQ